MMSAQEKVLHAYAEDALSDLLMGRWPYCEPEAYMAPSDVPTNWRKILEALSELASTRPKVAGRVSEALIAIVHSPEGLYCATEALLTYLRHRTHLSPQFVIDEQGVADAIRSHIPGIEADARTLHLDWMGPTTETLGERLERSATTLAQDHGVCILAPFRGLLFEIGNGACGYGPASGSLDSGQSIFVLPE
jgi:hypothetical protein